MNGSSILGYSEQPWNWSYCPVILLVVLHLRMVNLSESDWPHHDMSWHVIKCHHTLTKNVEIRYCYGEGFDKSFAKAIDFKKTSWEIIKYHLNSHQVLAVKCHEKSFNFTLCKILHITPGTVPNIVYLTHNVRITDGPVRREKEMVKIRKCSRSVRWTVS